MVGFFMYEYKFLNKKSVNKDNEKAKVSINR